MEEKIKCPKCGSEQITANKHGYSVGKAAAGAVLTGGVGLLAGFHGSSKIDLTCMACGNVFKPATPGEMQVPVKKYSAATWAITIVVGIIIVVIVYFSL